MPQKLAKPKFAPLTLDFTFKKAFANEQSTELLLFLINTFLAEKLKSPIKEVSIINNEQLGKTRLNRNAVFDVNCKDATGARFIVEIQVDLSLRNDKHLEVSYDMLQMTFVILPRFNKTESECKTAMDKILFAFKNGHKLKKAPKSFKERELRDIFNIAEISNFTESELYRYEAIMRNEYDQRACLAYAEKKGVMKTAKNMLAKGYSVAEVIGVTNLPREQIKALRSA